MNSHASAFKRSMLKFSRQLLKILLAMVIVLGLIMAIPEFMNRRAEASAQAFCTELKPGSEIAWAVARFETAEGGRDSMHYAGADGKSHSFVFPGFVFDRAYCEVELDANGKVKAVQAVFRYD